MSWEVRLSRRAVRDVELLRAANLAARARRLIEVLQENPFSNPPPYEKLVGDLQGCYSRRINRQHRLVYEVDQDARQVRVLRMWTHYE